MGYVRYTIVNITSCEAGIGAACSHVAHFVMMSPDCTMPDFRDARHPSRVYAGSCVDGRWMVSVLDSAVPAGNDNPRTLDPIVSRQVVDCCEGFHWGDESAGARQLAVALLMDVTGDVATTLRWHERFAQTYVSKLSDAWTVPEIDIALWLYCFQNARPGA